MRSVTFFFRHSHAIYFSIEKLFHAIAKKIQMVNREDFQIKELNLPFVSKLGTIRKNIAFTRKTQSEINHITGDAHYIILGCSKRNTNVLTIHDCVMLHHYPRSNLRYWLIKWLWYELPVKKADAVTVISENTKKDLLHFTNCHPDKIHVISNFIDGSFKEIYRDFNPVNTKLLFIGTAPNKNLERALEAIVGLDVELIIVGYLNKTQGDFLADKKMKYTVLNKLSDAQIRDVYAETDIMFFPSVHEGFGLPIIEAQATGRPVLTSQLEPMASVAGGAACLVDPYDVESIRRGLKKIIGDESYRNELIEKGLENVKRYQLGQVTKQYTDLYFKLIEAKKN